MLELRPICENCAKPLPADAEDARICSFECTFCADCVDNLLQNICPNCTGGFVPRPIRPKDKLISAPATTEMVHKAVDMNAHQERIARLAKLPPAKR